MTENLSCDLGPTGHSRLSPGRHSVIGTDAVAKGAPDGYTWLFTHLSTHDAAALVEEPAVPPLEDFSGVAMVANVSQRSRWYRRRSATTLAEFVTMRNPGPGALNYLNTSIGSSTHLNTEPCRSAPESSCASHVQGQGPALPDLLSGRIHFAFASPALVVPHVKTGKLRALAVAAPKAHSSDADFDHGRGRLSDAQVIGGLRFGAVEDAARHCPAHQP